MRNELAGDISLAAGKSQYDPQCKRVLANRVILAWILKYTVKEFENMSIPQIKKCIGNAISEYSITKRDKIPGIPDVKAAYDKLSVVMICLNPRTGKGNRLTQMLNILLSSEIKPERKIRKLEEEFHIPMEDGMGKELNQMCNLSDLVEEKGIQRGRKELLVEMIEKKLKKGKSIHRIADELEEDESVIRSMVEKIQKKEKGKIEDEQI